MKIVTVHTPGALHPETEAAIEAYREDDAWIIHEIDPADEFAYGKILKEHWNAGEDLCIIEPDILIGPETLQSFFECEHDYCCAPYAWTTDVGPALGCTRFRAGFMAKHPNVMRDAAGTNVTWRQLDVVIMRHILARDLGEQPHVHETVTHLNEAKALLPEANSVPLTTVPHW